MVKLCSSAITHNFRLRSRVLQSQHTTVVGRVNKMHKRPHAHSMGSGKERGGHMCVYQEVQDTQQERI